jgi:hypothetical protein
METLAVNPDLQCENCHKNLAKEEVKPVVIGEGLVKKYCAECVVELKNSSKNEKSALRSYGKNSLLSWRREILLGIAIVAGIGMIYLLYEVFN